MLHKKQVLIQTKDTTVRPNAKVTVQYIQPQQHIIRRTPITIANSNDNSLASTDTASADDLEIVENVEYLEETVAVDEFIEEQQAVVEKEQDEHYDDELFYPNAIHCLLDLYREKYASVIVKGDGPHTQSSQIWRDIAKEMHERYFEFEAEQIRQKYSQLRQHYFDIKNIEDIEQFEYFEQMHEIYKDPGREVLAKGGSLEKVTTRSIYNDETVVKSAVNEDLPEVHVTDFKSEEIVHKEHEFIDMVEKELLAMDEDEPETKPHIKVEKIESKKDSDNRITEEKQNQLEIPKSIEQTVPHKPSKTVELSLKRHLSQEHLQTPVKQKCKLNDEEEGEESVTQDINSEQNPPSTTDMANGKNLPPSSSLFTLSDYNENQERRHREQMQLLKQQQQQQSEQLILLEKSLKLHEKTLEQQNILLQALIKRFPTPS